MRMDKLSMAGLFPRFNVPSYSCNGVHFTKDFNDFDENS